MPMSDYMKALRAKIGTQLLESPAVSVVARDEAGRILLARHSERGKWVTPGGAVEPLETPADAAVREMWEETGVTVELTRIIGVYGGPEFLVRYGNGDEASYLMIVFEARPIGGTPRPDGVEVLEVRYFREDEVKALDLSPWMPEVLPDVFAGSHGAFRRPTWRPAGDER
jgi:8-oxo-dGTP pyrophosphatase MutT (NUDIX family)